MKELYSWVKIDFFFNFENICSRKSNDMFCLNDMSLKGTGFTLLKLAKSANAITAYLPFDVNFIFAYICINYLYKLD